MLGYDIIKEFPESNSHDPGFTHLIFVGRGDNDSKCRFSNASWWECYVVGIFIERKPSILHA